MARFEAGCSIIIDGPACVKLISGALRALGVEYRDRGKIIIREGRSVPLEFLEDSEVEILSASNPSFERVEEGVYPPEWLEALKMATKLDPADILVLGGVDVGKSTFALMLANHMLSVGVKPVAVVDGDLGQTDVGPPGALSYTLLYKPTVDLFDLRFEEAVFVGSLTPYQAVDEIVESLAYLKAKASSKSRATIVNTDGWFTVEALPYKARIVERLKPRATVVIDGDIDLGLIEDKAEEVGSSMVRIPPPKYIRGKTRSDRKSRRELCYKKYFVDTAIRKIPVTWVKFSNLPIGLGAVLQADRLKEVSTALGFECIYGEHTGSTLYIVARMDSEDYVETEYRGIKCIVTPYKLIERLLVGVYDQMDAFRGLAILKSIFMDGDRGIVELITSYRGPIGCLKAGCVKLDESFREIAKFKYSVPTR
ncbi:MAG: Clp1/GlmU family protein [Nitrososphaerota archaeon]|nr:Clp1/GlmU family protein [Candidatus Bathyarchaeota archaeon]MCX8161390.1 Clp1/GlmU family protein [Candidatus Bathyarchaeota archaeon]MDW8061306.1 Clp1/GlmU family protein [Nitrososphaerota archaeon]